MEHADRAVVFIDIVESVRLIELDEEGVVGRWLRLVEEITQRIAPSHGGRQIKNLGDGLLANFASAREAMSAILDILAYCHKLNHAQAPDLHIQLRAAIAYSSVIIEPSDIYGRGVNLASRLLTLAGPGEIIVTEQVRDQLVDEIDGTIEDLGECFLKHVTKPIRAYRVGRAGPRPVLQPAFPASELQPCIAVMPFLATGSISDEIAVGQILAEEIIRNLSRSSEINVISRLSTTALSARNFTVTEIGTHLNADYVLSGVYRQSGDKLSIDAELSESGSGAIVWTDRIHGTVASLLAEGSDIVQAIVGEASAAIIFRELRKSRHQPLPTLRGYTLLISAIALMHRLSPKDYQLARRLLNEIIARSRRQPIPLAWLGNWHVLRVIQGWSQNMREDANLALENTAQALDADPECSLALAIDGYVHAHLLKRFDVATSRYGAAIEANPNNAVALMLKGTMHAMTDQGELAVKFTEKAMRLSPLDPHRFIYETHCAGAHLTAGNFERARELARRARRANKSHASTLRILAVAQWELGCHDDARQTVREVLQLGPREPGTAVL